MTQRPLTSMMDNVLAWRLGEATSKAAKDEHVGDPIDRGLILLRELNEAGFDVHLRSDAKLTGVHVRPDQLPR